MTGGRATRAGSPTLEQVAARAGVSRSTVSRVVNGSPKVTAEAVAAVERAVAELGYVPNRAARSLATRRSHSIAMVIPEDTARFFADPYFAGVVQGVADRLAESEYTLSLLVDAEDDPAKTRRWLLGGSVDGALVLSHHSDDRSYAELGRELPVVFGGRPVGPSTEVAYVDVDNAAAARGITARLVERGRRRIATIAGPADMSAGIDRLAGWREAMAGAGLDDDLVEHGDFTPAGGAAAAVRLLAREPALDGLFAASAQMAFGALETLRDRGLDVPGDVAVVAVDDDLYARTATPPITTVAQPTVEVGRRMAELILARVAGRAVPAATILPTRVVERGSDGAGRADGGSARIGA